MKILEEQLENKKETQKIILERDQVCTVGVSPNVKTTVACGLKFHWYTHTVGF